MVFSTKIYESIDGGNLFVGKTLDRPPGSYVMRSIHFERKNDVYSLFVEDKDKARSPSSYEILYRLCLTPDIVNYSNKCPPFLSTTELNNSVRL